MLFGNECSEKTTLAASLNGFELKVEICIRKRAWLACERFEFSKMIYDKYLLSFLVDNQETFLLYDTSINLTINEPQIIVNYYIVDYYLLHENTSVILFVANKQILYMS